MADYSYQQLEELRAAVAARVTYGTSKQEDRSGAPLIHSGEQRTDIINSMFQAALLAKLYAADIP